MRKLRTVIVGLGRVGWNYHLKTAHGHDGFDVKAVMDVNDDRLKEAKEKYSVEGYKDFDVMLKEVKPELVVIASPTHFHRDQAISAFKAGADVFLDKPMARDVEEADAIYKAMEDLGKKLMIYQPHRLVPEVKILREIIDSGLIGPVFMFKRGSSAYTRRSDWQSLVKFGGGMLNNYGAHYIDQALYLFNEDVKKLSCVRYRVASIGDADDVVKIMLRTESDKTIDLDINMASAHTITPWMLFGKYGTVVEATDEEGRKVMRAKYFNPGDLDELALIDDLAAPDRKYSFHNPIPWQIKDYVIDNSIRENFYDHCYKYFAEGGTPLVPVKETLRVMRVIEALREDSGETVSR